METSRGSCFHYSFFFFFFKLLGGLEHFCPITSPCYLSIVSSQPKKVIDNGKIISHQATLPFKIKNIGNACFFWPWISLPCYTWVWIEQILIAAIAEEKVVTTIGISLKKALCWTESFGSSTSLVAFSEWSWAMAYVISTVNCSLLHLILDMI